MMLSRIAESLFWIGRYVARADGTARILDVHLQLLLEDPWVDEETACESLFGVMGAVVDPELPRTRQSVLDTLAADRTQPVSISYSLSAARENARRAREIISSELWETLNATQMKMPRRVPQDRAHGYFTWVRDRTALIHGIFDASTSRDEAWYFFRLGLMIERADMTARLIATRALTQASGPSWTTLLRSCGAYEGYLRTYRGIPSAARAAEFLIMDRLFPRSIIFAISTAEDCLRQLEPRSDRAGVSDAALRTLGSMRSKLEFMPVSAILEDTAGQMIDVQEAASLASEAVRQRYFPTDPIPAWAGEVV